VVMSHQVSAVLRAPDVPTVRAIEPSKAIPGALYETSDSGLTAARHAPPK